MYDVLEATILKMIQVYPFYANLIMLMDKKLTEEIPIAAVSVTSRINLMINPKTFNPLPEAVRVGILLHECYHIIHNHIGRSRSVSKSFNKALNIAADRAINEHIHILTKGNKVTATIPDELTVKVNGEEQKMKFVTKKNFQDTYKGKQINDNDTMEYYYKFLKDNARKGDGPGDFGGDMDTIDDHSSWEDSDVTTEQVNEVIKKNMNKAAENTSAGNIPGDVKKALNELNKSIISWNNVLQRFVAKCVDTSIDSSRKRRSRRFKLIHPGTIKEPKLRLGIAVDTSGSVDDAYLQQFFGEIKKIHSMGIEIFLVQADYAVQAAEEYNPKKPIVVKGRGGTAFQPAIDELQRIECDAIVYFTDGCTDGEKPKTKKPILWALCPPYKIPPANDVKNTIKITLPEKK